MGNKPLNSCGEDTPKTQSRDIFVLYTGTGAVAIIDGKPVSILDLIIDCCKAPVDSDD